MTNKLRFLKHVGNMAAASNKKRVGYSITNIFIIAFAGAFAYGVYWLATNMGAATEFNFALFILSIIGIVVCAVGAVTCLVEGFVAQLILTIFSAVAIANPEERKYAVPSLIICLVSIAAIVVAAIIFFVNL